jgi:hypothetical protein
LFGEPLKVVQIHALIEIVSGRHCRGCHFRKMQWSQFFPTSLLLEPRLLQVPRLSFSRRKAQREALVDGLDLGDTSASRRNGRHGTMDERRSLFFEYFCSPMFLISNGISLIWVKRLKTHYSSVLLNICLLLRIRCHCDNDCECVV